MYFDKDDLNVYSSKSEYEIEEVKRILLKNGFKQLDNRSFILGKDNVEVFFLINRNMALIKFKNDFLNYIYSYHLDTRILEVSVYDKDNIEVENYKYDSLRRKIVECNTGRCNNYDEAMNTVGKYFLSLFK